MQVYIIRHGQTLQNKEGIIQGHQPGKLSERGERQARLLAERLNGKGFGKVMSSDLLRARETLKPYLDNNPDLVVELREDLRERNLGEFQGMKRSDIGYSEEAVSAFLNPENGESLADLFERAGRVLETLMKLEEERVLLMSHGGLIKAMVGVLMGKTVNEFHEVEDIRNTSVTILEKEDSGSFGIRLLNCTVHLEEGDRT